jgi:glycogen debranching enzyme
VPTALDSKSRPARSEDRESRERQPRGSVPHISLAKTPSAEGPPEVPFYIPATGSPTRPRCVLKHGDSFAVLDSHGDIGASAGGADGLFDSDTRFLSRFELLLNGTTPLLLGFNVRDDNSVLSVDLTNPDIYLDNRIVLQKDTLHIVRTTFLWRDHAYQRIAVRNHGDRPMSFQLSLILASDFADIFEVRGLKRERRGIARNTVVGTDRLSLEYDGLDGKMRRTSFIFDPAPTRLESGGATYMLELAPAQSVSIFVAIACNAPEGVQPVPFFKAMISARRDLKGATLRAATVETSHDVFNEMMCRSTADLYMLMTDTAQGVYPYAGIPWYCTTFGRDGLVTALQTLWLDPEVARGVLKRLAAFQAYDYNITKDAEPGKILHEMRCGEMAILGEVPFGLYYGSVDATPLFVLLAGLYTERTGDDVTLKELWPAIEAALGWIDQTGDRDGDGFVEYQRTNEQGLVNQGWKDSFDAIFHADGSLAEGPIALAEVQGYVYAAKRLAAGCAARLGKHEAAVELERQAQKLAENFEAAFWQPDINSYALALDGAKRPCCVRTSNAGQLLFTGIVSAERASMVARELMRPHFFSGWGIRTVSSTERRYNPMAYHNGSIWPHDNALIALGLARYGHRQAVAKIFKGLFDAASYMDLRRLPELFCGFQRRRGQGPTLYPVACSPQAWASGTPFLLLQACLGLTFNPSEHEICLRQPYLPPFLDVVTLRNLTLHDASVDLRLHRHHDTVSVEVIRTEGNVRVAVLYDYSTPIQ